MHKICSIQINADTFIIVLLGTLVLWAKNNKIISFTELRSYIYRYIPVYGDIVGNMIDHLNHNSVTFSCSNSRTRELPVHCNHALYVAQPRNITQPYLET